MTEIQVAGIADACFPAIRIYCQQYISNFIFVS